MTISLIAGDSDPHLPKMGVMSFFALERHSLKTEVKDNVKYLILLGERGSNINWNYSTMSDQEVANRFQRYYGKRVCLISEIDEYFLQDALLSSSEVTGNFITLNFVVDERTVRNDAYFIESPADQLSELLEQLDEKICELRSVFEQETAI
ncbi:hypothetical protein [Paenibacillus gansuensis]|uniref:Uncharacterized protein n=1 Tax=Paenibacillus gansuensis TaxID=306542 RepID=A0ABW5PHS7_9BACL